MGKRLSSGHHIFLHSSTTIQWCILQRSGFYLRVTRQTSAHIYCGSKCINPYLTRCRYNNFSRLNDDNQFGKWCSTKLLWWGGEITIQRRLVWDKRRLIAYWFFILVSLQTAPWWQCPCLLTMATSSWLGLGRSSWSCGRESGLAKPGRSMESSTLTCTVQTTRLTWGH